jgi:hypothetical protein
VRAENRCALFPVPPWAVFGDGTIQGAARFPVGYFQARKRIMLSTILIVILILILIGALPRWGYSSGWGYGPGGIVGLILIIVIILALMGRI